jgi:hypothetical protein
LKHKTENDFLKKALSGMAEFFFVSIVIEIERDLEIKGK